MKPNGPLMYGGSDLYTKVVQEADAALIAKYRVLIDKFLEIAERKVAIIDDYGDENWEAIEQEIGRCVLKIAKLEGSEESFFVKNGERRYPQHELPLFMPPRSDATKYGWFKYANLWGNLEKEFRAYHDKCKANRATETFNELSGVDFEVYLASLLKKLGFENIAGTPASGDQGADLLATKDGRKIAIQAKRYKGSVGNTAVQEIVAALRFYNADEGWVITSGNFTQSARDLAHANGIRLIDGIGLRKFRG